MMGFAVAEWWWGASAFSLWAQCGGPVAIVRLVCGDAWVPLKHGNTETPRLRDVRDVCVVPDFVVHPSTCTCVRGLFACSRYVDAFMPLLLDGLKNCDEYQVR